ncbi:MAG: gephyrin-like molybdotransferase Glp [Candidatus Limnocylindrales bacterium]
MGNGRLLGVEEALDRVLRAVQPLPPETVTIEEAAGLVLAAPVVAGTSLPPWDNSAMDGYAVRWRDVAAASPATPTELRVVGESAAGHVPEPAGEPGTALRITTGAMVPVGADAVVPVEATDTPPGVVRLPVRVQVRAPVAPGANIRRAGEDVREGALVLEAGRVLGPAAIALAAACGNARLLVHRRPRVGVLATGDELTPPGTALPPAHIYDSSTLSLLAQARAAGAIATSFGIAPDEPSELRERLGAAVAASDVVVLSGGVSVGAHDHVREALGAMGEVEFWRVAVQPGKPLAFGRVPAARPEVPGGEVRPVAVFGLPGNPVSSFVTFELFVRPLLRRLAGRAPGTGRREVTAELSEAVRKDPERRAFLRVRLEPDPARPGRLLARPAGGQGSHVLSALAAANGLAVVPEGVPGLPAGQPVTVWELEDEHD